MTSWENAADAYVEAMRSQRRPRTLRYFRAQLPHFLETVGPSSPSELLTEHQTRYLNWLLAQAHLKPATAWGYLSRLVPFFRWLFEQEITLCDVTRDVRFPQFQRNPKRVKSRAEVQRFLQTPTDEHPSGQRNRVLLEFFYGTGLRLGEVQQLDVSDVQLEAHQVRVRQAKTEPRLAVMGPRLTELVRVYLETVRPQLLIDPAEPALWVSKDGRRLTYAGLCTLFKKLSRRCGLQITPHELRHCFATHILGAGAPLPVVQALLNHKTLLSTQIYTHLSARDVLKEFRRTHPRAYRRDRVH